MSTQPKFQLGDIVKAVDFNIIGIITSIEMAPIDFQQFERRYKVLFVTFAKNFYKNKYTDVEKKALLNSYSKCYSYLDRNLQLYV
jgi:hypothetical protein